VTAPVIVDAAGARMGGAARYLSELRGYLARTGRDDVEVIGSPRPFGPGWLIRRELNGRARTRRVALNNVGFVTPGAQRWTLLRNALHFLTEGEEAALRPASLRASVRRDAAIVRLALRRSEVIVAPSSAMAERVSRVVPGMRSRLVVRAHPVSAVPIRRVSLEPVIMCPVLFAPFKQMEQNLAELLAAIGDLSVRVRVTADPREVSDAIARHPCIELVGRLEVGKLLQMQASSRAIYYPTGLESFGYPLAEARVSGQPVIARDTEQNREIAGSALCGYIPGDAGSVRDAVRLALTAEPDPDPAPFDPDRYFGWLLGEPR
jgi:hypothetical protein